MKTKPKKTNKTDHNKALRFVMQVPDNLHNRKVLVTMQSFAKEQTVMGLQSCIKLEAVTLVSLLMPNPEKQ